jgi:hypothetical protein
MRVFSTFTPAFVVAIAWMFFFVIAGNLALRQLPASGPHKGKRVASAASNELLFPLQSLPKAWARNSDRGKQTVRSGRL